MRRTHKSDPNNTVEYAAKMRFWVVLRKQEGFFADKAAKAMDDEDKRARRRSTEIVEEV